MYWPGPGMDQNPFGFYAPPHMMMAPPQAMGPSGYYVVYQQPPLFMHAPPAASPLPNVSAGGQSDMAALLAATALTCAGMEKEMKQAGQGESGAQKMPVNVRIETPNDAKPAAPRENTSAGEVEEGKSADDGIGNEIAEV